MRHDVTLDGVAFRLRPVEDGDAEFILGLRTDPDLNRYIHPTSADLSAQKRWMAAYYDRPGDYYFIIERRKDGRPEGTVGIYSIDEATRSGEWGRWIIRADSMAGMESAWLVYTAAFTALDLAMVYSRTLLANEKVIRFHETTGCLVHSRLENFLPVNGRLEDAIEHRMPRSLWERQGPLMQEKVARFGKMLVR